MIGTAQYVCPEQASGSTLTPATDLYSLGVVAYECLAGTPPFGADTPVAIALMHLSEPPPPLPADIPPAVRELVMPLLAKDPAADRPAPRAGRPGGLLRRRSPPAALATGACSPIRRDGAPDRRTESARGDRTDPVPAPDHAGPALRGRSGRATGARPPR